jgi:hypothetical protein
MSTLTGRILLALAVALALPATAAAADDPINDLANALCAAPDWPALTKALSTFTADGAMSDTDVAEAFGVATFLGDLGRCANRQAIADGFAFYKKGKDVARLDAAFAMGRVAAKPSGGGTASAEIYQGSFATLATAGDPPSGQ